jgi:hypothetical protein
MKNLPNRILHPALTGFILAASLGPILHFAYDWSGRIRLIGIIAAVNESTWEHLKLGFWPLFVWGIFEYFLYGKKAKNFIFAKATALLSFSLLIPVLFYAYSGILGRNYLVLDISVFIVSAAIAQFIAYKIRKVKKDLKLNKLGRVLVLILLIMYLSFTVFPPHIFLFKDPVTGGYGFTN